MSETSLQTVADQVRCRAQEQGFVRPREIRADLTRAGLADNLWRDVLALVRPPLRYRRGRYYYISAVAARMRRRVGQDQARQRAVQQAVRRLIHGHRAEPDTLNRRQFRRIAFVCPVRALGDDRRELRLLSSDISLGGLRLTSSGSLQDQTLLLHFLDGEETDWFRVRILWSSPIADGLFQSGGVFVDVGGAEMADILKVVAPD